MCVKKSAFLTFLEVIRANTEEAIRLRANPYRMLYFWPRYSASMALLIGGLQGSALPKEDKDEVMTIIGKLIAFIPSGDTVMQEIKKHLIKLRTLLQLQHACEQCGKVSECSFTEDLNFKCLNCGYSRHVLFRRELMDLNDPVEGELAMQIMAGACGWERIDGK